MVSHINFEAKSDRELLLLVAQQINAIAEQRMPEIENRMGIIELECKNRLKECQDKGQCPPSSGSRRKDLTIGAVGGSGTAILVYGLAKAVASHFGVTI